MRHRLLLSIALTALAVPGAAAAYPWPFKPFDRQHPIRGFFGDPRTVFSNEVAAGGIAGPGSFGFHQGVDIAAPDGTPIYAIADGRVHYLGAATLNLVTGRHVTFQYFHIVAVVGEGQRVRARQTVLGYVQPPYGHVHISEIDGARVVNPLQPGHLAPYADRTAPKVSRLVVQNRDGPLKQPLTLCGTVQLVADAFDTPPLPVPGAFDGLPVAPAYVKWLVTRNGKVVVKTRYAADFRKTVPPNGRFWGAYARGTYENAPRFGREQYRGLRGRYLFVLAARFDTRRLLDGNYRLTVTAGDERRNTGRLVATFAVHNTGVDCPASLSGDDAPALPFLPPKPGTPVPATPSPTDDSAQPEG